MTTPRERVSRVVVIAFGAGAMAQVLNQVYFFFVLRLLSVEHAGVYSWAMALTALYGYVTDFGLTPFLVREIPRRRYGLREVLRVIVLVRLLPVLLAIALILGWVGFYRPASLELTVVILMAWAQLGQLLEMGLVSWLQVGRRQSLVNLLALINPAGRVISVLVMLAWGVEAGVFNLIAVLVLTQVISLLAHLVITIRDSHRHSTFALPAAGLWTQFKSSTPRLTVLYALMAGQARLDWILVSHFVSSIAVANYALANRVVELTNLGSAIWAKTTYPWIAEAEANGSSMEPLLRLLERIFVVASGVVSILLVFLAPPLIRLLFEGKYDEALPAVRIMASLTCIFMLNNYFFYVLLGKQAESRYVFILAAASLTQLMINVVLLPRIGIVGAAMGMIAMGLIVHVGQLSLLMTSGWLRLRDVIRMETFVGLVISLTIVSAIIDVQPLLGAFVVAASVGVIGMFLLLTTGDRQRIQAALWLAMARGDKDDNCASSR